MNSHAQRTYDKIFQHPMTHNLEWRNVRAMFDVLGEVHEEHNGNLKVTLSGHSKTFQSPSNTDIATSEMVMQIRHFIRESEAEKATEDGDFLIHIDHKQARIFRTETAGSVAEQIKPEDNLGHAKHVHSAHDYSDHIEKANHGEYFKAITTSISDADRILIFGDGTGSSSTMDLYVAWLKEHFPKLSERIIGAITIDESHLTDGQILAKARELFAAA